MVLYQYVFMSFSNICNLLQDFPFLFVDMISKHGWPLVTDVWLVVRQQTLHFAKYVNCDNFGEVMLRGFETTTMQLLSVSNVMGRRQVVVSLDSRSFQILDIPIIMKMDYRKGKHWLKFIIIIEWYVRLYHHIR